MSKPLPQPEIAGPILAYMSRQPVLSYVGDRNWRLVHDVAYEDWDTTIMVPAGFVFDLSSVPRIVWALLAPIDLGTLAPLLHDWIYRNGGVLCTPGIVHIFSRKAADEMFREVMALDGVKPWKRRAAYAAVRLFGWWAWKRG